jgi:hypothetical protein
MVAMDKAAEQEQRPSTPKNPKPTKPKTVGSSCTWRNDELQRFAVQLEYGVDPRRMIPDKFWEFDTLSMYTKRNSLCIATPPQVSGQVAVDGLNGVDCRERRDSCCR